MRTFDFNYIFDKFETYLKINIYNACLRFDNDCFGLSIVDVTGILKSNSINQVIFSL